MIPDRSPAAPGSTALVDALGAADPQAVEAAVAAILRLPAEQASADLLFAAARACEDKLVDPGRATVIYERIAVEYPDARVAVAAARRLSALRPLVGPHGETAAQARELAQMIARAGAQPDAEQVGRAEQLADAAWPGAPTAALWLAEALRRAGRLADAQVRYAAVVARWPDRPEAQAALRGGAGCALDAHDWSLAEALASRLQPADPADHRVRDDLLAAATRGRRRARWYAAAWIAIAVAFTALFGSLAEAALRSPRGTRWAALRPPIEIAYLAPVAAVLIGVAFTAHRLIAPAVTAISLGGIALSWLSGAALERLRTAGRPGGLRSAAHIALCVAGVAALAYVALMRDNLLDMLLETVRFGPEGPAG
jgi:hypothetical protein